MGEVRAYERGKGHKSSRTGKNFALRIDECMQGCVSGFTLKGILLE